MIRTITNKSDYKFLPELETDVKSYNTPVRLFGKPWYIMDDYWMKHIHLKITDRCNAACPFCIEKNSHIIENAEQFITNVNRLLNEMDAQGHLTTVSITGGEPSLCDHTGAVIALVKEHNCFLNINTNFSHFIIGYHQPDWLNISCHTLGPDNYCRLVELRKERIAIYRHINPGTKIRIQCVLHKQGMQSISEILSFITHYKDCVDDFSFRRLISLDETTDDDLLQQFKHYLFDNADLVEQVLKDYYVYETWQLNGALITLSHSNMGLLRDMEESEPDNILREIIVHPDGLISGSWYRNKKIIFSPYNALKV